MNLLARNHFKIKPALPSGTDDSDAFCDIAFWLCTTYPRLINHNERTSNNCITITLLSTLVNQQLLIVYLRSRLVKLCLIKSRAITLDLQKLNLVYVVSSNLISVSQNLVRDAGWWELFLLFNNHHCRWISIWCDLR